MLDGARSQRLPKISSLSSNIKPVDLWRTSFSEIFPQSVTIRERCHLALSPEPVDLMLLIQVTGPDLDFVTATARHYNSRNRRCRAVQSVLYACNNAVNNLVTMKIRERNTRCLRLLLYSSIKPSSESLLSVGDRNDSHKS
uniref:Uncharacterized protein n=1 Tax=Romanomermis culicivorax TaxID=13658 RepID=A0A915HF67_ROMCU